MSKRKYRTKEETKRQANSLGITVEELKRREKNEIYRRGYLRRKYGEKEMKEREISGEKQKPMFKIRQADAELMRASGIPLELGYFAYSV